MENENLVNELEEKKSTRQKNVARYRELLSSVIRSSPSIHSIVDFDDQGDMVFSVNLKELGLTNDDFYKYHKEIFSNFVVDFIGELLIRENLPLFVNFLTSNPDSYLPAVSHCNHKRFGMKIDKGNMVFRFHISLLQGILTEDFKIS